MKVSTVFSKLSSILNTLNYFRRRRKEKLYEQWVQRAGLPPEAIPRQEVNEDITPKIEKERLHQPILYILLGASLAIFGAGLIILIVQSC
jgi:hypothetical protein